MTDRFVLGVDVGRKNLAMALLKPGDDPSGARDVIVGWAVEDVHTPLVNDLVAVVDAVWARWHDGRKEWSDVDVVIERQPLKNPSMTRMQHLLEAVFALRGAAVVTTIDPKHKLAFAARTPWWPTRDVDAWTYVQRKKLAVETVANMLAARADATEAVAAVFDGSKKKDDLADALLHAMAYAHVVAPAKVHAGRAAGGRVRAVKAVKPTDRHVASGKYPQGALKHVAVARKMLDDRDVFAREAAVVPGFEASCLRHFGTMDNAFVQLG